MCGKHFEPDLLVAWPKAEVAVMGPDGMIGIAALKTDGQMPPELREKMRSQIADEIDIYKTAGWDGVDDIIDPRDTRRVVIQALEATRNKKVERPKRRNPVLPV